jgi:HSP20 family protein
MRPSWADPTGDFLELRDRLYRLLDESFLPGAADRAPDFSPPVDILATDDRVIILAEVPGMSREQIQVQVEDTIVTIRGERRVNGAEGQFVLRERPEGSFSRSFSLAWTLDPETVEAKLEDGLLAVSIRRRDNKQNTAVREE